MDKEIKKLISEINNSFDDWQHIKDFGCYDPTWEDGVNMNLVRNHITYYKRRIKEICEEKGLPLPDIYNKPTPPEVDRDYMARAEEIKDKAIKTLALYENDENFKKLQALTGVTNEDKSRLIKNILGYMYNLKQAIDEGDLVTMRRHNYPDTYLESAKSIVDKLTDKDFAGQMSMF